MILSYIAARYFFALLLGESRYGNPFAKAAKWRRKMTLDQLIAQIHVERAQAAGYVQKLDSALSALTKATAVPTVPTAAPKAGTGRVWTPEQKMKLSAALKKNWAAKKKQAKG
jgi:hypothetical protein